MNGALLDLYHIYVGKKYLGCVRAKNEGHAKVLWAKDNKISSIVLRAEKSASVQQLKEAKR